LTEKLPDVVITCTGGAVGTTVAASVYVSFSAPITNRLDDSGAPTGIPITNWRRRRSATPVKLNNPTLLFSNVQYTIPATPVTITISGVRVGVGLASTTANP